MARRAGDPGPDDIHRKRVERLVQVEASLDTPNTTLTMLLLIQATSKSKKSEVAKMSSVSTLPPILIQVPKVKIDRSLISLVMDNTYSEWLVDIKAQKHALGGEYLVHIFLGPVQEDEATILYSVMPYHVGKFSRLGQPEESGCGKRQQDQEAHTEITGQIPLTIALVERYFAGALESLDEADVIEYLKVTLPANDYILPHYSPDVTIYPEISKKEDGSRGRDE